MFDDGPEVAQEKPDLKRGDKVQLRNCPRYNHDSHTARITGDLQYNRGRWEAPVKYNCIGNKTAVESTDNMVLIRHKGIYMQNAWYASKKAINIYIIVGVVIILVLIFGSIFGSVNNTYVNKSQTVSTDKSNISKEEQRRVDLFNNLADAVISAKNFEQSTLTQIAQARGQANSGNVSQAEVSLNSVVEAYPDIKSVALYSQTMLEMSATENRLAQYRETYNDDVKDYNAYVQGFPSGMFLSIEGKNKTQLPYLNYNVDNAQAQNVFKTDDTSK